MASKRLLVAGLCALVGAVTGCGQKVRVPDISSVFSDDASTSEPASDEQTSLAGPDSASENAASSRAIDDEIAIEPEAIVIAMLDGYPPYSARTAAGDGIVAEVVKAAYTRAGVSVTFDPAASQSALERLRQGRYDAMIAWGRTDALEDDLIYSRPIVEDALIALVRADADFEINDKSDLDGKTICLPQGRPAAFLDDAGSIGGVEVVSAESAEACLALLSWDQVDAVIAMELQSAIMVAHMGLGERIVRADAALEVVTMRLAFPRAADGALDLRDGFDREFEQMLAEGEYLAIVAQQLAAHGYAGDAAGARRLSIAAGFEPGGDAARPDASTQ